MFIFVAGFTPSACAGGSLHATSPSAPSVPDCSSPVMFESVPSNSARTPNCASEARREPGPDMESTPSSALPASAHTPVESTMTFVTVSFFS